MQSYYDAGFFNFWGFEVGLRIAFWSTNLLGQAPTGLSIAAAGWIIKSST
jgi:hypothetical protein